MATSTGAAGLASVTKAGQLQELQTQLTLSMASVISTVATATANAKHIWASAMPHALSKAGTATAAGTGHFQIMVTDGRRQKREVEGHAWASCIPSQLGQHPGQS